MRSSRSPRSAPRAAALVAAVVAGAALLPAAGPAAGPAAAGPAAAGSVTATASSTAAGSSPAALADGNVAGRALGGQWRAADSATGAWVQLTYPTARTVSSVQVFGPTAGSSDPEQPGGAPLYGRLRFSDGSTVAVAGIETGGGMPTTVAFPPRPTTSVRLELERQVDGAPLALRELTAYDAGSPAPRWAAPATAPAYAVAPRPASCSASSPSVAPAVEGGLSLACPAPGASAQDTATVVVNAPAGASVRAWVAPAGAGGRLAGLRRVAAAGAGADGRAVLRADLRALPQGPVVLEVTATGADGAALEPLHVQLFHAAGRAPRPGTGSRAPAGMSLVYADDFSAPLSVSDTGWQAQYAAIKPEASGGSMFGDALFADPAWGASTLASLPGGYLRIRAQDIGPLAERRTWDQPHAAGILSSQRVGGSGFSAQQAYFEARVLGAPGPGAWSAFWLLDARSGTPRTDGTTGEADVVELYGHDTHGVCQTNHHWTPNGDQADDDAQLCRAHPADWAAQWHTYGARLLPGGRADYYVDGVRVAQLDQLAHSDEPFFFMLDLATGGGWPVDLAATGQTSDMYVDWVRVWT